MNKEKIVDEIEWFTFLTLNERKRTFMSKLSKDGPASSCLIYNADFRNLAEKHASRRI